MAARIWCSNVGEHAPASTQMRQPEGEPQEVDAKSHAQSDSTNVYMLAMAIESPSRHAREAPNVPSETILGIELYPLPARSNPPALLQPLLYIINFLVFSPLLYPSCSAKGWSTCEHLPKLGVVGAPAYIGTADMALARANC